MIPIRVSRLAFFLVFIIGCEPALIREPKATQVYYNFITSEGLDFFQTHSNYLSSELTANDETGNVRPIILDGARDGISYFRTWPWTSNPMYFDYGNGDMDTLTMELFPSNINPVSDFNKLNRIKFFFNQKLITDWNFEVDPNLRDSIHRYNGPEMAPYLEFPVSLIIVKDPNPNELQGG